MNVIFLTLMGIFCFGKITTKSISEITDYSFSTVTPKNTSIPKIITQFCKILANLVDSNKIVYKPQKVKYNHLDQITYSCQSGYYLQKPINNLNSMLFDNVCLNGTWKINSNRLPICGASCLEWNVLLQTWQSVFLNISFPESGYIISPKYPNNLLDTDINCTFIIMASNRFLKLTASVFSMFNFYLEISTNNSVKHWSHNMSENQSCQLVAFEKIFIRIKKHTHHHVNNIKFEKFKLFYKTMDTLCETFYHDPNLLINRTKISNIDMIERYSCIYPYTLIGPSSRSCLKDNNIPPVCEYTCPGSIPIIVDNYLSIKIKLDKVINCKILLKNKNLSKIFKIKIKKSTTNSNMKCLYLDIGYLSQFCIKEEVRDIFFVSPTDLTIFNTINDNGGILELFIESIAEPSCSSPQDIKNALFQFQTISLFSVAKVHCINNLFLFGSSEMTCKLDVSGTTYWYSDIKPVCIQLCSYERKIINLFESPLTISIPSFFSLNFTANQFCRWQIQSSHYHPIIAIKSIQNFTDFVNVSVTSGMATLHFFPDIINIIPGQKDLKANIFMCPEKVCNFTMIPQPSINKLTNKLFIEVTIKLGLKIEHKDYNPAMVCILLLILVLCIIIILSFLDFSRHPYTGYTAKLINLFKSSKIKKIAAFSMINMTFVQPFTKTESDFIVYYKKYHSENNSVVHIQRSFSCAEINKDELQTWKNKLRKVKRRFSDITDLVFIGCSSRSENTKTNMNNNPSTTNEEINLSYVSENFEFI